MMTCAKKLVLAARPWSWMLAFSLAGTVSSVAQATPTAADDATATALFKQGIAQREAGHAEEAINLFRKSHALQTSPRPGLEAGKLLMAAGLLIEAQEIFKDVVRLPAYKETPKTAAMRAEAAQLAGELDGKIGSLIIQVKGPLGARSVWLDGQAFRPEMLGVTWLVNPAEHGVELREQGRILDHQTVTVAEGGTVSVELSPSHRVGLVDVAPATPGLAAQGSSNQDQSSRRSLMRTAGWVGVGAGGVGLGVGFVLGALALSKSNQSDAYCDSPTRCQDRQGNTLRDQGLSLAAASTGFVIAGGVLAASGALLLWRAPSPSRRPRTAELHLGPTSLALSGTF